MLFLSLSSFFSLIWSDGLEGYKAFVVIVVAEVAFLACVTFGGIIVLGHPIDMPLGLSPKLLIVCGVVLIAVLSNRLLFERPELAAHCKAEFSGYSATKQGIATIAAPLLVVGLIAASMLLGFAASHR